MEGEKALRNCSRCGEVKPVDDFAWRRKRELQRDTFCRPCRSAYGKEHYAANRQRYIDQAARLQERTRLARTRYLIDYFEANPCVDCGEPDPVVLEFDHIAGKNFDVGTQFAARRWDSILEEIEKCEVVCANCHRRRTARRRGALRYRLTRKADE